MKLKDVPNLMLLPYAPEDTGGDEIGYNQALSQMSEREITLNRERLVKVLASLCEPGSFYTTRMAVDAIIAALPELLEGKKI